LFLIIAGILVYYLLDKVVVWIYEIKLLIKSVPLYFYLLPLAILLFIIFARWLGKAHLREKLAGKISRAKPKLKIKNKIRTIKFKLYSRYLFNKIRSEYHYAEHGFGSELNRLARKISKQEKNLGRESYSLTQKISQATGGLFKNLFKMMKVSGLKLQKILEKSEDRVLKAGEISKEQRLEEKTNRDEGLEFAQKSAHKSIALITTGLKHFVDKVKKHFNKTEREISRQEREIKEEFKEKTRERLAKSQKISMPSFDYKPLIKTIKKLFGALLKPIKRAFKLKAHEKFVKEFWNAGKIKEKPSGKILEIGKELKSGRKRVKRFLINTLKMFLIPIRFAGKIKHGAKKKTDSAVRDISEISARTQKETLKIRKIPRYLMQKSKNTAEYALNLLSRIQKLWFRKTKKLEKPSEKITNAQDEFKTSKKMAGKTILNIGRESRHAFLSLLRISKKIFQKTSKSKIIFKKAKPKEKISRRLEKTSEKDLINEPRKRIKRGFVSFFGVVQEAMKKTASPFKMAGRKIHSQEKKYVERIGLEGRAVKKNVKKLKRDFSGTFIYTASKIKNTLKNFFSKPAQRVKEKKSKTFHVSLAKLGKKKSKTFHVSLAKLGKKKSKTFARKKKQKTTEELIEEARIKTLAKNKQRKTVGDLIEETKKSDEKKDNFKY